MNEDKIAIRKRIAEQSLEIDRVASAAMEVFEGADSLSKEIQVAQAMRDMLELLTPEIMAPIMALADTGIGFKTDRDPSQWNKKTGKLNEPYPVEVVKRCFAESRLRGFHCVGNEWNILVGNFFVAQAGLARIVRERTKGTFEWSNEAPKFQDKQALIKVRGWWELDGKKFTIGIEPHDLCEFSLNAWEDTKPASIVGKGYRMLLSKVLTRITGRSVPAAEADDVAQIEAPKAASQSSISFAESAASQPENPKTELPGTMSTKQVAFAEKMVALGISFTNVQEFLVTNNIHAGADALPGYANLPEALIDLLDSDKKKMANLVKTYARK